MGIASILTALTFNVIDMVTGFCVALKAGNLESGKLRDGLFKKVGFICCYFVGWIIDNHAADMGFKIPVTVLPAVIAYCVLTELVSICENINKLNPDLLPEKLMSLFKITGDNTVKEPVPSKPDDNIQISPGNEEEPGAFSCANYCPVGREGNKI